MDSPIKNMRITFWGTRGSHPYFPQPAEVEEYTRRVAVDILAAALDDLTHRLEGGDDLEQLLPRLRRDPESYQKRLGLPQFPVYGGDTTCIEVETAEGDILLFDCGSGIRHCATSILGKWRERHDRTIHLFGSHEHIDHRSGLPFAGFCFAQPPFRFNVYGPAGFLRAIDESLGVFSHQVNAGTYRDDPLDYTMMTASFRGTEIRNTSEERGQAPAGTVAWAVRDIDDPIEVGLSRVTAFHLFHGPTACLGYRVDHEGKSFVFCTDHEVRLANAESPTEESAIIEDGSLGAEMNLRSVCRDADLAYFDGQYFLEEYLGHKGIGRTPPMPRINWGHSCIEDVVRRVRQTGVKRAYIGHHDPERSWSEQVEMDVHLENICAGESFHLELAKDWQVVDI